LVTYILCPNTEFKANSSELDTPIVLVTNAHYLCGENGSSTNNCTVTGGFLQAIALPEFEDEEFLIPKIKSNVLIAGLIFKGGDLSTIVMVSPGDFVFRDCLIAVRILLDSENKVFDSARETYQNRFSAILCGFCFFTVS
jgi:hypothetical protein